MSEIRSALPGRPAQLDRRSGALEGDALEQPAPASEAITGAADRIDTSARALVWPFVLTLLTYLSAGVAAFALAIAPGLASPFYPAAGVALVSVIVYGRSMLPAVLLGSFAVSAAHYWGAIGTHVGLAGLMACASGLQALVGARLVRRFVRQPLMLEESRDVVGLFVACALACIVSSGLNNLALWTLGRLETRSLPLNLAIWWLGDLLGMLVAVPIGLTLVGRPRVAWAPRRSSVGVTLALAAVLLAAGIHQVTRWHLERSTGAFDRDAASASRLLAAQLDEPLEALKALHGVFLVNPEVSAAEMHAASVDWLASGRLLALGWIPWLSREQVPALEARLREQGAVGFRVSDRDHDRGAGADPHEATAPIVYIEPRVDPNLGVIGLDTLSISTLRAAIMATIADNRPAASAVHVLATLGVPGILIYQAVFRRTADPASARGPGSVAGLVFATIRLDQQLQAVQGQIPAYLGLCIFDASPGEAHRRIAGPSACETTPPRLYRNRELAYAGRHWELRVYADEGALPGSGDPDVWLFALVGLLSTGVLGSFLLIVTGRTRRIETAVEERTAALTDEVRERERAQTALRETEQRFRNILNNVPIGVIYTDLEGNVKQSNPRFCELLGYREDELLGLNSRDYTHPEEIAQELELTAKLLRGEIPMYRCHKRCVDAHGQVLWVQATVTLLRDAAGEARRIVGVVEDVTEHMKLEEAERAREAAEASNQAKSEFLSRMSHELRTPLNAMLGFAQLLELDPRHPLNPTQKPWVMQIQRAGWHLLEMINDVLDLSRIESGNLRLQTETLNLVELIDASCSMVQADAQKRGIVIQQDLGAGAGNVRGDATRVKQVLTNLLSNAVKYNVDNGRVELTTRAAGDDAVVITVTDTGLGMTPEQLGQLFQPFNRLGLEKSTLQGTGIGLVISQRLAELMGGTLRARSSAGVGSSFILRLPSEVDPDTVRSEFDLLLEPPSDYHTRVVHYVEDNEINVEVMRGILAQRPQVALEVSITGLDGLAAIRARRPDLILLDMHLPDINGMELLRHLKADARLESVPVVIVSADALAQQIEEAHAAGCADYLTKPVNVSDLLRVVDELLERVDTRFN